VVVALGKQLVELFVNKNAIVYVCGNLMMAEGVRNAFADIIQEEAEEGLIAAKKFIDEAKAQRRYNEDVFGVTSHFSSVMENHRGLLPVKKYAYTSLFELLGGDEGLARAMKSFFEAVAVARAERKLQLEGLAAMVEDLTQIELGGVDNQKLAKDGAIVLRHILGGPSTGKITELLGEWRKLLSVISAERIEQGCQKFAAIAVKQNQLDEKQGIKLRHALHAAICMISSIGKSGTPQRRHPRRAPGLVLRLPQM
jgi:hypothetical protein